jgi:dipeptide/tripeptide permease
MLFLFLCLISIGFWTFYFLEPTLLTVFSKDNLNLNIFGINFPPNTVFSLDPFFVIVSGFFLTRLWLWLECKNKDPSIPLKFIFASLWVGLGYILLAVAISLNSSGLMNIGWMIAAYFLFTMGELFIAPVGFSMVGQLSPKGSEGFLMGVWQLSLGISATASVAIAGYIVMPSTGLILERNVSYMHSFMWFAVIGFIMFVASLLFLPWMKRMLPR